MVSRGRRTAPQATTIAPSALAKLATALQFIYASGERSTADRTFRVPLPSTGTRSFERAGSHFQARARDVTPGPGHTSGPGHATLRKRIGFPTGRPEGLSVPTLTFIRRAGGVAGLYLSFNYECGRRSASGRDRRLSRLELPISSNGRGSSGARGRRRRRPRILISSNGRGSSGARGRPRRRPRILISSNGRGSRSRPAPPETKKAGVIPAIAALPASSLQNRRYQTSTGPVGGRKRRPGDCPFGSLAQERSTAGPDVDKIVINTHQCAPREMVARADAFPFSWLFSAERRRSRSDRLEARHGPTCRAKAQPQR